MKEENSLKIATRLKKLREKNNLSQRDLATLFENKIENVLEGDNGKQLISKLENGKRSLTNKIANAYVEVFDVSLDYIFYGKEIINNKEIEKTQLKKHKKTFQEILYESSTNRFTQIVDECTKSLLERL